MESKLDLRVALKTGAGQINTLDTFQRLMWFSWKMNDNFIARAYQPAVDHSTHDPRAPDQFLGSADQNG